MKSEILKVHERLKNKEISCLSLIEEKLTALKKNQYNTSNFLLEKQSKILAKKVDKKIADGKPLNILEGLPFGIKDVYLLQGAPAAASSDFLKNYQSSYTATAIQKLLDAGAIPIVKENCDSFGHGSTSENTVFGAVKNAHNPDLVAGGSTGGSAVNVAKGYTIFSIGGDTGGSIRQPAGFNKVYGLKPSYGRISRFGLMAYASSSDCVGILTTNIYDISLLLNIMSGKDNRDQTSFESKLIPDINKNFDPHLITIGYYNDFLENEGLDQQIKHSFLTFIDKLKDNGLKIKTMDFKKADTLVSAYYILAMAETASNLARLDGTTYGQRIEKDNLKEGYALARSENFTPETQRRIIAGNQVLSQGYSDEIYLKAKMLRNQITQHFAQDCQKVDLILSPVSPTLPSKIGSNLNNPLTMYLSDIYTVGFSLAGLPTLSAPLATNTGIQISAAKNKEFEILQFSQFLEKIIND